MAFQNRSFCVLWSVAACVSSGNQSSPKEQSASNIHDVTILFTTDEHGWVEPYQDNGSERGGASNLLVQWIRDEHHCVRDGVQRNPKDCKTLALSGGDNWTGPAISSYFRGVPMAEAMGILNYTASAFGNHEFDFGREQFQHNRALSQISYLASNIAYDASALLTDIAGSTTVQRNGVTIGIVGLATESTLITAMPSRFVGMSFTDIEQSLDKEVKHLWSQSVDTVVVIAHECFEKFDSMLAKHPEWNLAFVGTGHCHRTFQKEIGNTVLLSPGWKLQNYGRIGLQVDTSQSPQKRILKRSVDLIRVSKNDMQSFPIAERLTSTIATWRSKLSKELGVPIGYTTKGLEQSSETLGIFLAETWRQTFHTDAAIINRGGIRQALSKGIITKETIFSILPFDNQLLICKLTGKQLIENLNNEAAIVAGLKKTNHGQYVDQQGVVLDDNKTYRVVIADFIYLGGDKFHFQDYDPSPEATGVDFRKPVMDWLGAQQTSAEKPLEEIFKGQFWYSNQSLPR